MLFGRILVSNQSGVWGGWPPFLAYPLCDLMLRDAILRMRCRSGMFVLFVGRCEISEYFLWWCDVRTGRWRGGGC